MQQQVDGQKIVEMIQVQRNQANDQLAQWMAYSKQLEEQVSSLEQENQELRSKLSEQENSDG